MSKMPTKISEHRNKYAFYLRQKPLEVVRIVRDKNPQLSLSSAICLILDQYSYIHRKYPGAIAQAKNYFEKLEIDFTKEEFAKKEQAYLNKDQENCLATYAKVYTSNNQSQAINNLIAEYACLAIIHPNLLSLTLDQYSYINRKYPVE